MIRRRDTKVFTFIQAFGIVEWCVVCVIILIGHQDEMLPFFNSMWALYLMIAWRLVRSQIYQDPINRWKAGTVWWPEDDDALPLCLKAKQSFFLIYGVHFVVSLLLGAALTVNGYWPGVCFPIAKALLILNAWRRVFPNQTGDG